ncbi:MAG: glycolate oxidase subunit GlcF [Blastomonas sp.]
MQTSFPEENLRDPKVATAEQQIRKCVHCGFCTATCPTYLLLKDELDSPRGRIYLMKEMLENERKPTAQVVKHVDRCLSCLSCMSTCPSGVNYMHLVDHARSYIEDHYQRPPVERAIRAVLAFVLPTPWRFRAALRLARPFRLLASAFASQQALRPLASMLQLAPRRLPAQAKLEDSPARSARLGRVALMQGCAEPVLRPEIREATIRVLNRAGYDVVFAPGEQCCGALVHHMGKDERANEAARANIHAWTALIEDGGLSAIISTASGCGTSIKNYGFMLRNDPDYAARAKAVSALARDISEFLAGCDLPRQESGDLVVAYQSACSLQHGQKVDRAPAQLLEQAGYVVRTPVEAHICCGSAGTYNIFQPEIATQLRDRKIANIERLGADIIATGNIGCATQLAQVAKIPVVHTIELIDWASGGPRPQALSSIQTFEGIKS